MFNVNIKNLDNKDNELDDRFDGIFFIGLKFDGEDVNFATMTNLEIDAVKEYIEEHLLSTD